MYPHTCAGEDVHHAGALGGAVVLLLQSLLVGALPQGAGLGLGQWQVAGLQLLHSARAGAGVKAKGKALQGAMACMKGKGGGSCGQEKGLFTPGPAYTALVPAAVYQRMT